MNYFFIGQDAYPKKKALDTLKTKLLKSDESQFNMAVYYADSDPLEDILSFAGTMPFGALHRIVVVKKADRFTQKDLASLVNYLKAPAKHTTLILDAEKMTGRSEEWKKLMGLVHVSDFEKSGDISVTQWVENELSGSDKKMAKDAILLLYEYVGKGDFTRLKNELDKLVLYTGERPQISKADVELMVGKSPEADIFKLVETISRKEADASLNIVSDLLLRKIRPHEIVGLLAWHFRKIYMSGRTAPLVKKKISDNIEVLLSTDLSIKRSRINPVYALEVAILKLCKG